MSDTNFKKLKEKYIKDFKLQEIKNKKKMKDSKAGPNANDLKNLSNGKNFTKTVFFSYKEGLISGRDASNLLDVKLNRMEKMISIA